MTTPNQPNQPTSETTPTSTESIEAPRANEFASESVDLDQVAEDLIAIGLDGVDTSKVEEAPQTTTTESVQDVTQPPSVPAAVQQEVQPVQQTNVQQPPQPVQAAVQQGVQQATPPVVDQTPKVEEAKTSETLTQPEGPDVAAIAEALNKNRNTLEAALAEQVYALNDEARQELDVNPAAAIPKLMAKLHTEVALNILGAVAQHIPQTIMGVLSARERQQEAENEFWTQWPELNKKDHQAVVQQVAASYAALNPQADRKTRITQVGLLAATQLGLLPAIQARMMNGQAPVAQPQPVVAAPRGFVPANRGQVSAAPQAQAMPNPFTEMTMLMEQEDG